MLPRCTERCVDIGCSFKSRDLMSSAGRAPRTDRYSFERFVRVQGQGLAFWHDCVNPFVCDFFSIRYVHAVKDYGTGYIHIKSV
jgi:hypothetical protein